MDEKSLIALMTECGFTEGQITSLKKVSVQHGTSLFDSVCELDKLFFRTVGLHTFMCFLFLINNVREWLHESEYKYSALIASFITLIICSFIIELKAPLIRCYRSRKVMRKIRENRP